jgi:2-polyprenyl-6-methoxyphenol hydroxylase-like FAD-dependent oxidoreductase
VYVHSRKVVIIGAGLAGSIAAVLLGRQGYHTTIIDRYERYPDDFRAEQLVGGQVATLHQIGILDEITRDVPRIPSAKSYRKNRFDAEAINPHYGLSYQTMITRVRGAIPKPVIQIFSRAVDISTLGSRRLVRLATGEAIAADLVIVATGLNTKLTRQLGVKATILPDFSMTLGFDVFCPIKDTIMVFRGENLKSKIDYFTVFPYLDHLRGNIFSFHSPDDPWLGRLKSDCSGTLRSTMVSTQQLHEFSTANLRVRANDIMTLDDCLLDGIVFIGDAYQTSCPSTGTGVTKVLTDTLILCNRYVPCWLAAGDAGRASIAEFYNDPVKSAFDRQAMHDTRYRKELATNKTMRWQLHRTRLAVTDGLRTNFNFDLARRRENAFVPA